MAMRILLFPEHEGLRRALVVFSPKAHLPPVGVEALVSEDLVTLVDEVVREGRAKILVNERALEG